MPDEERKPYNVKFRFNQTDHEKIDRARAKLMSANGGRMPSKASIIYTALIMGLEAIINEK